MTDPAARAVAAVHLNPDVAALVVESTPELGATLLRYTAAGELAGDVWYGSADEARLCAARDYGSTLGPWRPLPPHATDPVAYAWDDGDDGEPDPDDGTSAAPRA
jgi:hypothetical protein